MGDFISEVTAMRRGIENLISWFRIIWNDRNYDYTFIYKILYKKLSLMLKEFNEDGYNEEEFHIQPCLRLLEALIENKYGDKAYKDLEEKWGKTVFIKAGVEEFYLTYDKVTNEQEREKSRNDFLNCVQMEDADRKIDREKLFNLISEHIESWWD